MSHLLNLTRPMVETLLFIESLGGTVTYAQCVEGRRSTLRHLTLTALFHRHLLEFIPAPKDAFGRSDFSNNDRPHYRLTARGVAAANNLSLEEAPKT